MMIGRSSECETLDRLLGAVRRGESRALIVRGDPGVGKTALLEYVVERAAGCRVARATAVQSEMELAFAGLHQLCTQMLDRLDRLPGPQRDALATAFGLHRGPTPDRFLIGLATLTLLSEVAEERPLVCVVDDAQWLDQASAQALAFAARRLFAESVALLCAVRGPAREQEFTGLQELVVHGLPGADARALLASVIPGPLDARVRDRIIAETQGNPLALLELPRGLTPAQLAGGFGLPGASTVPGRIEDGFRRRLEGLPKDTRRLLMVAAAEPLGEPVLLWRAAERLGIETGAATPATAVGLLELAPRVRFRHPLVRSAVYRAGSLHDRRRVHGALADATDPEVDPDRRAWHRAHAAPGPDEEVAEELERSAGRAQSRGGFAAAAAFLERAAGLTLEPSRRAERALAAAQATHLAGAPDPALELLATAEAGPLGELQRARVFLLRAQIAYAQRRGSDAPPLLLRAAKRLEPLDAGLARDTYLEALSAAQFAGRLAHGGGVREAAKAARAAPPSEQPPRASDLLLDGLAVLISEGYATGAPMVKRALHAFRDEDLSNEEALRWLWLACRTAIDVWDCETWHVLSSRLVSLARGTGALAALPIGVGLRMGLNLRTGDLAAAASLSEEQDALTAATGSQLGPYGALLLVAWRGREAEAIEVFEASRKEVASRGEGIGLTVAQWASAVLHNGLGRYGDALTAAQEGSERPQDLNFANASLVELVEAAARTGNADLATDALDRLTQTTRPSATDWALGMESRCRALVTEGEAAERLYRDAIERLGRTRIRVELARAHLLYGEWLRRENRRLDAREQLRMAHGMLTAMGIEAFADRAARELLATGETARKRAIETSSQLTAQEAQIARLAREGLSNPEIGSRLFISPRTVQYHLSKVFTKLDISSRNQLDRALPGASTAAQPT
jgi:DNA-binding CsgD family transcriptional regulator/tetratricopeptide (TPR) repeat protein